VKELTMGCRVEESRCSICGAEPCAHVNVGQLMARDIPVLEFPVYPPAWPGRRILGASMVPAPKCDSCGNPMGVHEGRDWVCRTDDCQAEGFVVAAHLYQVFPAKVAP
jgi:hypothetical protein